VPGPINALRFVHSAIFSEAERLENRAHSELGRDEARQLAAELAVFDRLMDGHTKGEEVGLFPKLAEREPHFAETYLRDHEVEHALFRDLAAALESLSQGDDSAHGAVRRLASAIRHHVVTHIGKENELVLPYVDASFSPPEQGQMLGQVLSVFTPQDLETFLPWIVARLDDDTAVSYLGALGGAQPPAVFAKSCAWIKAGIPEAQRARLAQRVDALA